jgi:hypothetical protein
MRRNLIELGAMLAVSAALVVGAMDRAQDRTFPEGGVANSPASSLSNLAMDAIAPPAAR